MAKAATKRSKGACPSEERLAAYAEQALTAEETSRVDEHARSCRTCRSWLDEAKVCAEFAEDVRAAVEAPDLLT